MDQFNLESIQVEIRSLLANSALRPEPQISAIRKCLSKHSIFNANDAKKAIIDLVNSLGIQFRSDNIELGCLRQLHFNSDDKLVLNPEYLKEINSWSELLTVLDKLPKEWTILQINKSAEPMEMLRLVHEMEEGDPTIMLTKFSCGNNVKRNPPYCVGIPPKSSATGLGIVARIREILNSRTSDAKIGNYRIRANKHKACDTLMSCVLEIENYWLRGWKCIFTGTLEDSTLDQNVRSELEKVFTGKGLKFSCSTQQGLDIIYSLALTAHHFKDKDLLYITTKICASDTNPDAVAELIESLKNINKSKKLSEAKKNPLILIVDNSLEIIPWEMCVPMLNEPVVRNLSLHSLFALFKAHESHIVNGFRQVKTGSIYSLINPSNDLVRCQEQIGNFVNLKIPWCQVEKGTIPESSELTRNISENSIYIYCGHGTGGQYLQDKSLYNINITGVQFLYGCASNKMHNNSTGSKGEGGGNWAGRVPSSGTIVTLMTCGSPCIVGMLYDVDSNEADSLTMGTLSAILPTMDMAKEGVTFKDPIETNLLRAIHLGKNECKKYWTKADVVVRGIPIRFVLTEEDKELIIKKCSVGTTN